MATQVHVIWIVAITAAVGTAACTLASPTYISSSEAAVTDDGGAAAASSSGSATGTPSGDGGTATCSADDFVKPDLATLKPCGENKGHCYAKDKISYASALVPCADAAQVCVPDEILLANGQPLKTCTSVAGVGGCVTGTLFPELIKQGGAFLKPDVCGASMLCVPCKDPSHGMAPTGFCEPNGPHKNACGTAAAGAADGGAATTSAPCCTTNGKSNGVCLPEVAVPEAQRKYTKQDVCPSANKCVPAALVAGAPVTCSGGLFGPGVCMDKCFNDMMSIAGGIGILSKDKCGSTELCIPCGLVSGQGVPGCK